MLGCTMTDVAEEKPRRPGGREGRRAMRAAPMLAFPTLVREIPVYDLVPDEAVELIHLESLNILEEVGCEFRDAEALETWKAATRSLNSNDFCWRTPSSSVRLRASEPRSTN